VGRAREWLLTRDIGLVRYDAGLRMLACMSVGIAVGYAVSVALGLVPFIGMMIGALPPFLSCLIVVDGTAAKEAGRTALLLVPFAVALLSSAALRDHRLVELLLLVVLLFVQFWAAAFGTVAGDLGIALFSAYLCGLLLPLPTEALEKLVVVDAAALAATVVVRALLFRPAPRRRLLRVREAFLYGAARVLEATADFATDPTEEHRATLRRRVDRLRETALVADGLLGEVGTAGPATQRLHELLFDTELSLEGVVSVSAEMLATEGDDAADLRRTTARALRAAAEPGPHGVERAARHLQATGFASPEVVALRRRLVDHLTDLADSSYRWQARLAELDEEDTPPFDTSVTLVGGRVKGSNAVLEDALAEGDMSGPWRRFRVGTQLRTGIQAAVAVALCEPLALLTGGTRYYWAVIGVLVIFAGTSSVDERVRKAGKRIAGTVVGGVIGIALVALVGADHPYVSVAIVLVAVTVGTWAFAAYYSIWVVCLVVLLCQVYVHAGMFTNGLLVLRLVENSLGALLAVLVSLLVLPVRTGALVDRAVRRHLDAVAALAEDAGRPGEASADRLRADARAVDVARFQLRSVLDSILPTASARRSDDRAEVRLRLDALTAWCHRLARHAPPGIEQLPPETAARLAAAGTAVADAARRTAEVVGGAPGPEPAPTTTEDDPEADLWVRERLHLLQQVDNALTLVRRAYLGGPLDAVPVR
jgi:uncharacterized membrane protein YccC